MTTALPVPDGIAQAHSLELTQRLKSAMASQPLPFSTYMQRCLYEPGLGYYMAGSKKFGSGGDFITAPEVSPVFGACLAMQCSEILTITGGGILELGAGSGRLALSVIQALDDAVWSHYFIVEPSADLSDRQQQLLKESLTAEQFLKLEWLTGLPDSFDGVILANEVMDAFPVERVVKEARGFSIESIGLSTESDKDFERIDQAATAMDDDVAAAIDAALTHVETDSGHVWQAGYRSELSMLLAPWINSLSQCLTTGALLLIDYGYPRREYYLPERTDGTLQCFYRPHAHDDVTFWPGLQDITAHVDFTSVVEAGDASGLELLGYTSQASFLMGCGIAEIAQSMSAVWGLSMGEDTATRVQQQQAINRLTLPGEMGERFQVMALGRGINKALMGFSLVDLSHRL